MRHTRLLLALLLLGLGARPALTTLLDDLWISYAYALSLLERGELAWGTGDRVEGYSNFLWVLYLAAGRALGAPVTWWAKAASFLAAAALLADLHRRAPRGPMGAALLLAVAAWSGLATWAGLGMETTAFALATWLGWGAVAAGRAGPGLGALAVAALLRPEGTLYLVGGALALRGQLASRTPDRAGWLALGAVAAWHAARWAYFGDPVPLPIVAKLDPVDPFPTGLRQAAVELLVAAAPLGLALATLRVDRRAALLAALPVALHLAMLLRMHGDWMGDTRILLPGLLAALAVVVRVGVPRERPFRPALGLLPLLLWTPARGALVFRPPALTRALAAPLRLDHVPLLEDTAFAIRRVPAGGRYETADIGLPGLVPGLRVVDAIGLADRARARHAPGVSSPEVDARYRGEDALACVRRPADDPEARTPRFRALIADYRSELRARAGQGGNRWWCRPELPPADDATVRARWLGLLDRLPELPAVRWRAARVLADQGEVDLARAVFQVDPHLGLDPEAALFFTVAPEPETFTQRGFRLGAGEALRSRPVDGPVAVEVQVDAPPGLGVSWAWLTPEGETPLAATRGPARLGVAPPAPGARLEVRAVAPGGR